MVQYFEFQYFGVFLFQKNEYFLGYEDFVDILGVITKGVISMQFRVVSKGQGTELGIFFGFVKFHFFFWGGGGGGGGGGVLDIPDNFGE